MTKTIPSIGYSTDCTKGDLLGFEYKIVHVFIQPLAWAGSFFLLCFLRNVCLFPPMIVQVPHLLRLRFNQSCRYSIRPSSFYVRTLTHSRTHEHRLRLAVRWGFCTSFFFLSSCYSYSFATEAIFTRSTQQETLKASIVRSLTRCVSVFVFRTVWECVRMEYTAVEKRNETDEWK